MKLLIGVPCVDYVHTEFVKSLTALILKLQRDGVDFTLDINPGSLIHIARDKIACKAINKGYTHILWLDSDMVFGPDLLEDLQFCGKPFVTGICASRRPPYVSCVFTQIDDINHMARVEEIPPDPFEVQGCGFACVLMETRILEDVMMSNHGTCFLPMASYGEDLAFCIRARRLGHHIWADPAVRPGHVSHQAVYYPDAHEQYMRGLDNHG